MISGVRGALPATLAALAWLGFAIAYAIGARTDPRMPAVLVLAMLFPAAVATRSAWETYVHGDRMPSDEGRWLLRAGAGASVGLLLAPLAWASLQPGPSLPAWPDSDVTPLLPGPGAAWAYTVAVALTIAVTARRPSRATSTTVILGASTFASLIALLFGAAGTGFPSVSCTSFGAPASGSYRSVASGELDGVSLGTVDGLGNASPGARVRIEYSTRWRGGTVDLASDGPAARTSLASSSLGDGGVTADDLGFDRVTGAGPTRHCQTVIDGATAIRTFPALRWLVGADESTADPGRGFEAWRGRLDYWLTEGPSTATWVLASVDIDGQPPDWPFPGLHATLRATTSFEPHG